VREEERDLAVVLPQREACALDRRPVPRQLEHAVGVVVAAHQPLAAGEPGEHGLAKLAAGVGREIAHVPDLVVRSDARVPALDHESVVRLDRLELAALAQDVRVAEMRVRREEDHAASSSRATG
jgi:hypothetical protein